MICTDAKFEPPMMPWFDEHYNYRANVPSRRGRTGSTGLRSFFRGVIHGAREGRPEKISPRMNRHEGGWTQGGQMIPAYPW